MIDRSDVRFPIKLYWATGEVDEYESAEGAAFDLEFYSSDDPDEPSERVEDALGRRVRLIVDSQGVLVCELEKFPPQM